MTWKNKVFLNQGRPTLLNPLHTSITISQVLHEISKISFLDLNNPQGYAHTHG